MTTELDTTGVVRAWLDEGVTRLPDRVLDAVMDQVPATPQRRRRSTATLSVGRRRVRIDLIAAAILLALTLSAGLLIGIGSVQRPAPDVRQYPSQLQPLPAGRYAVGPPFPVRFGIDVIAGWRNADIGSSIVKLERDRPTPVGLMFTFVDRLYEEPCRVDRGLMAGSIGSTANDLADYLTSRAGLSISRQPAVVGGRSAVGLTISTPSQLPACTDGQLHLWGLPEEHWLGPNERNRFWIVDLPDRRLVISAEYPSEVLPDTDAEIERMIASIRFNEMASRPAPSYSPTPPPSEAPVPPLPATGPIAGGPYYYLMTMYSHDSDGVAHRVRARNAVVLYVPDGWVPTGRGIASGPAPADATVGTWTISKVYHDPCHWQTSTYGNTDGSNTRTEDSLAEALSAWWPDAPGTPVAGGLEPPRDVPLATRPAKHPWMSRSTTYIELRIPTDLGVASCDGGEYRIWEDMDGSTRTAQPGEQIRLRIVDLEPGIAAIEWSSLPGASDATLQGLLGSGPDTSINRDPPIR